MKALLLAVLLAAIPFAVNAGTTDQFAFSNGGALAEGFGADSCNLISVDINVARSGNHNLSNPSTTGFVEISVQLLNFCTNTFNLLEGFTANFQFSAPGAPNILPQSVQASGTMTVFCSVCPGQTDTLTFSLNLQAVSSMTLEQKIDSKQTSFGITTEEHYDNNVAYTTGTVGLTSSNLGTFPISSWQTQVNDQHQHTVTITH